MNKNMLYSVKEKEIIFKDIKDNGFTRLENLYSEEQLNKVKKSLLSMLNYMQPNDKTKNLQEKYYEIKNASRILKGHFYDLCRNEVELLRLVQDPRVIDIVKGFFNVEVVFSGNPGVFIRDDENDRCLDPHQETNQLSRDTLIIWAPLYDAKGDQGGITIYKDSHKYGYYKHHKDNKLGSSCVNSESLKKFEKEKQVIEVEEGSAILFHSALIHGSAEIRKKNFAGFIINDRLCPLKRLPYLTREKSYRKIPYYGHGEGGDKVDYNTENIYII